MLADSSSFPSWWLFLLQSMPQKYQQTLVGSHFHPHSSQKNLSLVSSTSFCHRVHRPCSWPLLNLWKDVHRAIASSIPNKHLNHPHVEGDCRSFGSSAPIGFSPTKNRNILSTEFWGFETVSFKQLQWLYCQYTTKINRLEIPSTSRDQDSDCHGPLRAPLGHGGSIHRHHPPIDPPSKFTESFIGINSYSVGSRIVEVSHLVGISWAGRTRQAEEKHLDPMRKIWLGMIAWSLKTTKTWKRK